MGFKRITGGAGVSYIPPGPSGALIIGRLGTANITVTAATSEYVETIGPSGFGGVAGNLLQTFIQDPQLPIEATTATYTTVSIVEADSETGIFTKSNGTTGAGAGSGDFFGNASNVIITQDPGVGSSRGILITYGTASNRNQAISSLQLSTIRIAVTYAESAEAISIAATTTGVIVLNAGEEVQVPAGVVLHIDETPSNVNNI